MTGGLTIAGGTVIAGNNTALGFHSSTVTLNGGAGLSVNNGITVGNPLTFSGTGNVLSGNGTVGTGVVDDSRLILSPGFPLGNLTINSGLTLASGGTLSFHLYDAAGSPGTGFNSLSATGGLNLTASANTLTFNLQTIDGSGNAAPALNFNSAMPYSWRFATSTTAISGFNAAQFTLATSGFLNGTGGGTFGISEVGNSLYLNFTPVPEPSTWAMMAAGVFALVPFLVRRQRAAKA